MTVILEALLRVMILVASEFESSAEAAYLSISLGWRLVLVSKPVCCLGSWRGWQVSKQLVGSVGCVIMLYHQSLPLPLQQVIVQQVPTKSNKNTLSNIQ